jgi:shikimate dehydrogenase
MHNKAFEYLDLNYAYLAFPVAPDNLKDALRGLAALGIAGANVTFPYKERVLELMDKVTKEAEISGSVNTILVKDGKLIGYNTDGEGFVTALKKEARLDPRGKRVVIIGAGGSARAISIQLARAGIEKIVLTDLVFSKAQELIACIGKQISGVKLLAAREEGLENEIKEADILINATPVGMKPNDPSPVASELFHPKLLVCDLIYNPSRTTLLREAARKGAKTLNGMGMLLYQGALAFTIWTGREAPIEAMAGVLKEEIKR